MSREQQDEGGAPRGLLKRRREDDEADGGQQLTMTEGKAFMAMLRAKWKSALAKDSIGMTGDRLIQYGDLSSEIVEVAVLALRLSWPMISPERVRDNLEGYHALLMKRNVGVGNRILLGKRLAVLIAADVVLGVREAAAEEAEAAAAAVAAEQDGGGAGGALPSKDDVSEEGEEEEEEQADIEMVLESSEAGEMGDKEGGVEEEESSKGDAQDGSANGDSGDHGGGGGGRGDAYLVLGVSTEPSRSGGAKGLPRGLETPAVQSLLRPASPAPGAPGPGTRIASRAAQLQRSLQPQAGPQLAEDGHPHIAATEGEASGGARGGIQTEDDAVDGGPHVAATALQPTATAGQTGHRPRRAATAVAVRQTVPPRKPAVAAAAKAKPAPASAPPERKKARGTTTPSTLDAVMTGYVAPEEDAIHAALEAQKTDKRRAAAKAAAAAQAEKKAEGMQRALEQAAAEFEDLCYRLQQAEKEKTKFANKAAAYKSEQAKLLSEAQAAEDAAREKAEKVAEAKEQARRKVGDIKGRINALERRFS